MRNSVTRMLGLLIILGTLLAASAPRTASAAACVCRLFCPLGDECCAFQVHGVCTNTCAPIGTPCPRP